VHRPFSLYFNVALRLLSKKIAIPAPTPKSFLLPSVYASIRCEVSSYPSIILTCVAGWSQFSVSLSYWVPIPFVIS